MGRKVGAGDCPGEKSVEGQSTGGHYSLEEAAFPQELWPALFTFLNWLLTGHITSTRLSAMLAPQPKSAVGLLEILPHCGFPQDRTVLQRYRILSVNAGFLRCTYVVVIVTYLIIL